MTEQTVFCKPIYYTCLTLVIFAGLGCDPQRTKQCEWYLEPDLKSTQKLERDWVPLCVKNYKINRQKCHLFSKIDLAESVYGKTLRYSELEIDKKRQIHKVDTCEPIEK